MPWARLEDQRWRNRKMRRLSWGAIGLDDVAISYCCDNLTNGVLTPEDIEDIAAMHGAKGREIQALVDELVAHERWVKSGENWRIHDFLEYNPSAKQVKDDRKAAAKRQADARERRRKGTQAVTPTSVTDASRRESRVSHAERHGPVTRESQHPVPTRPDPSRPDPIERQEEAPRTAPASATRGTPEPDPDPEGAPTPRVPVQDEPDPDWQADVDRLRSALARRDRRKASALDAEIRSVLARQGDYAGIPRTAIRSALTRGLEHLLSAIDAPRDDGEPPGVQHWGRYVRHVVLAEAQNGAAAAVQEQAEQHRDDLDAAAVALLGSAGRRRA